MATFSEEFLEALANQGGVTVVSPQTFYEEEAKSLGKKVEDLTPEEKKQAIAAIEADLRVY